MVWRTKLNRAFGLVVAFATLDGYGPLASAHDSADEFAGDLPHPHARERRPLQPQARRREHGTPPVAPVVCVSTTPVRRQTGAASQRPSQRV